MKTWDVKTEPFVGFEVSVKKGSIKESKPGKTRVQYRTAGSRGRWKSFVLEGVVPSDLQQLVTKFEELKTP